MWIEYQIPADFEMQKRIIGELRTWILSIEEKGLVKGFAFNHYFGRRDVQDDLRVRFDYPDKEEREVVRELQRRVREFIPEYVAKGRPWESEEEVLKAYEFGSRCAFLFLEKGEGGRLPNKYISDYRRFEGQRLTEFLKIPLNFQWHLNHGIMNSLGVPKLPNEAWIHLLALIEVTGSRSPEELCRWIGDQPPLFFKLFGV